MTLISTREFLGIDTSTVGDGLQMPVGDRAVGGGRGSLFGGVGLAAGIVGLEAASGKPAVWATGQYVSTMFPPSTLDLDVTLSAVGRTVTQGRVIGTHDQGQEQDGGRGDGPTEIISVLGTTGVRAEPARLVGESMPDALDPEDSLDAGRDHEYDSIHDHVDVRMARGMFGFSGVGEPSGDHRSVLWTRFRGVRLDAAALAILADYSPSALGNSLGRITFLSSLDNTIRFVDVPTGDDADDDWVLLDNRVEFVGNGFGHSSCTMWSRSGTLLAVASQSMTVIVPDD